jgi:N6-L-threonylcarbamoyladenine synthase
VSLILGIETSCDETGAALISEGRLAGQKLATQVDVHSLFGGVVPEIASREHLRILPRLVRNLLEEAGAPAASLSAVAVARGPGLLGSLLVGVSFADGLSLSLGVPIIGVDHLLAHLAAPGLERDIPYPCLGLLVSGGHTSLYLMRGPLAAERLGRTLDDAAGEAFDKAAKALNLPYPGGPYVEALAGSAEPDRTMFPRPYLDNDNLDFSFSGLKTAVMDRLSHASHLRFDSMVLPGGPKPVASPELARFCASFSQAVTDTLTAKVRRALDRLPDVRGVILAGGVAANERLRRAMERTAVDSGREFIAASPELCTDNAAMIAYLGWLLHARGLRHRPGLGAVPRGRPVPWDYVEEGVLAPSS